MSLANDIVCDYSDDVRFVSDDCSSVICTRLDTKKILAIGARLCDRPQSNFRSLSLIAMYPVWQRSNHAKSDSLFFDLFEIYNSAVHLC